MLKKSTCWSVGRDQPRLDMEARRSSDAIEQARFSGCHPDLAGAIESLEECSPSFRIEVRGDLIEEQDRWVATALRHEIGVRENEAKKQGFLLSRRRLGCRHLLGPMNDREVLPVRPLRRATRGGVA